MYLLITHRVLLLKITVWNTLNTSFILEPFKINLLFLSTTFAHMPIFLKSTNYPSCPTTKDNRFDKFILEPFTISVLFFKTVLDQFSKFLKNVNYIAFPNI